MKITIHSLTRGIFALAICSALSACSLLTIERITEQPRLEIDSGQLESTLSVLEGRLERQDDVIEHLATQVSANATQNVQQDTHISYLATRGPAPSTVWADQPPTVILPIAGGVEIEGGKCCVGGTAGEEIEITVRFTAMGLQLPATQMRYLAGGPGYSDEQLNSAPWEPYAEELVFTHTLPTNWTGFYVRVQFRDSLGNLSPIYQDDISVEGMPALTPAQPENCQHSYH